MTLIIGFSKAKNWWAIGSNSIQIAEKRNFSHCYVRFQCELTGADLIAQASHGRVNIINFSAFEEANTVVQEFDFDITAEKMHHVLSYIYENLGVSYSRLQLILIAIKKTLRFEINVHNKDESFICSELAGRVCEILNILVLEDQDYLTPSDLHKLLTDNING